VATTRLDIEEFGRDGAMFMPWWTTPGPVETFWRAEASCARGPLKGAASSVGQFASAGEAFAELDRMRAAEDASKYDTWDVVKYQPYLRITIETREES
jgi:hypothetical protein